MNELASQAPRWDLVAASILATTAFVGLAVAVAAGAPGIAAFAGVLLLSAVAVRRPTLPWSRVLVVLLLVILFVPIRRYRIPGDLPFQLEPYRVLVGLIVLGWLASLLVDPRARLGASRFEVPVGLILVAMVASIAANPERASEVQSTVLKSFTFFLSFVVVFYLVVSVVRSRRGAGSARQDTRRRRRGGGRARRDRGARGIHAVHAAPRARSVPHTGPELRGCDRPRRCDAGLWSGRASDRARCGTRDAGATRGLRGANGERAVVVRSSRARRRRPVDGVADRRRDAPRRGARVSCGCGRGRHGGSGRRYCRC